MRHAHEDPRLQPFDLGRGRPVLLVHGFTGTPFEMRFLGGHLARHGFRAVGVRLPGHGLDPFALERATATEWINEARAALIRVSEHGPAHVIGLSMGGLISTMLAAEHPERVAGLVLCAPAFRLFGKRALLLRMANLRFLSPRLRFAAKGPSDLHDPLMRRRIPNIGRIPAAAAEQFDRVRTWAWDALEKVRAPAMIVYSEKDKTVPTTAALECARRLGSRPVRMVRLERSSHVLTLDVERVRVAQEIERFIRAL